MPILSVRITEDQLNKLNSLVNATERKRSFIVNKAIDDFLEQNAWQVAEIKKALVEADNGDFVDNKEMSQYRSKWLA